MAWDASRPVPWRRLIREWLIYVAIMSVIFLIFFRDDPLAGIFAGLLASGPLYLLVGYVLAKVGYRRRSLREARAGVDAGRRDRDVRPSTSAPARPKPAPTRRTGGGTRPGGPRPRR
jgi:hypothetical protein